MFRNITSALLFASIINICPNVSADPLQVALEAGGENAAELRKALDTVPAEQKFALQFLIENMPARDLRTLQAEFLVRDVDLAYRTWKDSSWQVPEEIFLNNILPYASINESRDDFRQRFHEQFSPLVKDTQSPGEAAAILNNKIFKQLGVKYSRKRRRADQGPLESIESGLASCTGLSVLLIDACRSVGVPARFVGTPLWSDRSGNHSWVEVWDDGWHFTGAAEPTGMELDKGWFIKRSSMAKRDDPKHAIYAVSYKKTPLHFPLVWDRSIQYVPAVNVTDRYAGKAEELPDKYIYAMFQVTGVDGERCCTPIRVKDQSGKLVFAGETKDERFDGNDHVTVALPIGASFAVELGDGRSENISTKPSDSQRQLFTFTAAKSSSAVQSLDQYLRSDEYRWDALSGQNFSTAPLAKSDAQQATDLLVQARTEELKQSRAAEMKARVLTHGELKMPFFYKTFGEKPKDGRSLYISMHGGGGAPSRVNDRQWENQKRLYEPQEGVYVAPRAPTDKWNLWHEGHIMPLFDRLIENMVLFEDVDPNKVYVMGYSAGGDGVYQLAPRMADRWAAAAMMAGHPNDAKPQNLRNIGFAIYMGGKDAAYNRNKVAAKWGDQLKALKDSDPDGYQHLVTIYPDKGHWMERQDASALPWMAKFTREPFPQKVVWRKDGNRQSRFYWLGANVDSWKKGQLLTAEIADQSITVASADELSGLSFYLNDELLDLDQSVEVVVAKTRRKVMPWRTVAAIHASLTDRFDPTSAYTSIVTVADEVAGAVADE